MWHSVCSCCRRRGARWQMLCQLRHDRTVIYGQRRVVDELPGKRPTTDDEDDNGGYQGRQSPQTKLIETVTIVGIVLGV